jgi:fructosamine-3-kinase
MLHAYLELHPLADGWRQRVALWQLYPLLVHSVLFGGGYRAEATAAARRYAPRRR